MSSLRERYHWRKVEAPKSWQPGSPNSELIGFYSGRTKRVGSYGEYEVVLIAVPGDGLRMISGVHVIQLFDAAGCTPGDPVRVVYLGTEPTRTEGRTMKHFEVFISTGERIPVGELPEARA